MYDYLIVGQGLAGSILGLSLMEQGKKIMIVDDSHTSSSSLAAAGLINPVVFKRLSESWRVDEQLPFAALFYGRMEKLLDTRFYYERKLLKVFTEEDEKKFWLKKASGEMGHYLSSYIQTDFFPDIIHNPLGCAEVKHAANLDVPAFINAAAKYFTSADALRREKFDPDEMRIENKKVSYKNITATRIIFCEGYKASENRWFSWLPFSLTKGEVLTVEVEDYPTNKVVNKGVFILPLGNDLFKVGATYRWDGLDEIPTQKGLQELKEKLEKVLKVPYRIVEHKAGIRPTVKERKPFLGLHPQHPELGILNGLGSKGVLLAPYFASHFIDHLESNIPLDTEVDIKRFY